MISVVGAAGYAGGLLTRILARHPHVGAEQLAPISVSHAGQPVESVHHDLLGRGLRFLADLPAQSEVVFLCTGHGAAQAWMQTHDVGTAVVIDLSADHRGDPTWTYGLPERNREATAVSKRIANPGCFATGVELALLPLAEAGLLSSAIVHATTGSSGAGQAPSPTTHYSWRANNLSVYKAFTHQHLAEINMVLGMEPTLIPLRGAFTRGILVSSVLQTELTLDEIMAMYRGRYETHPYTEIIHELPDVKRAVGTNYCLIGLKQHNSQLLIVSVLDNLVKGASGQAVQNMNIAMGWNETDGLDLIGVAP